MSKEKNQIGVNIGFFIIAVLAIIITGISFSVWAEPYNSSKDTLTAIIESVTDTTSTCVVTNKTEAFLAKQTDSLSINIAFLRKMRENGELLSSNEFASRITGYYNTLVAVLTALFVLFTLVTYITIKSKFEAKFDDKARELEDKQRQNIVDELRNMLNDSKKIDEVITSAIGGHIDDKIATKEEFDDLLIVVDKDGEDITVLMKKVDDLNKKQQELFKVVADMQELISEGAIVQQKDDSTEEGGVANGTEMPTDSDNNQ